MISTGAMSSTLSAKIARIVTARPQRATAAVHTPAFKAAYAHFAAVHPAWVDGLFDEHFLTHAGRDVVDAFVVGGLASSQAAVALATAWDRHLGPAPATVSRRRIADATAMSAAFLQGFVRAA